MCTCVSPPQSYSHSNLFVNQRRLSPISRGIFPAHSFFNTVLFDEHYKYLEEEKKFQESLLRPWRKEPVYGIFVTAAFVCYSQYVCFVFFCEYYMIIEYTQWYIGTKDSNIYSNIHLHSYLRE